MTKLEKGLFDTMCEYGATAPGWRLKITERNIIGNSDLADLIFEITPPRKHKPHHGTIRVNFVRGNIYWETYKLTPDRR